MNVADTSKEPTQITAGDLIQWTRSLAAYPAGDWVLSYVLMNAGKKITITATADGTNHAVSVSSSVTRNYPPGTYQWRAFVTADEESITVGAGEIEILPDFRSGSAREVRSQAQIALAAIDAVLANRATLDQQQYTIQGRTLVRMTPEDLLKLKNHFELQVQKEAAENALNQGLKPKNRIYTRI